MPESHVLTYHTDTRATDRHIHSGRTRTKLQSRISYDGVCTVTTLSRTHTYSHTYETHHRGNIARAHADYTNADTHTHTGTTVTEACCMCACVYFAVYKMQSMRFLWLLLCCCRGLVADTHTHAIMVHTRLLGYRVYISYAYAGLGRFGEFCLLIFHQNAAACQKIRTYSLGCMLCCCCTVVCLRDQLICTRCTLLNTHARTHDRLSTQGACNAFKPNSSSINRLSVCCCVCEQKRNLRTVLGRKKDARACVHAIACTMSHSPNHARIDILHFTQHTESHTHSRRHSHLCDLVWLNNCIGMHVRDRRSIAWTGSRLRRKGQGAHQWFV